MARFVYAILVGLFGAGIVHILIVLMVPDFAQQDAWTRLGADAPLFTVSRVDGSPAAGMLRRAGDPLFVVDACRFRLDDGYARITAPGRVPLWSVSVYDRNGQNVYSFNDRANPGGDLDFIVATPAQVIALRKDQPEDLASSIFVEKEIDEGIVLVRAFVPDQTWMPRIVSYMNALRCLQGALP